MRVPSINAGHSSEILVFGGIGRATYDLIISNRGRASSSVREECDDDDDDDDDDDMVVAGRLRLPSNIKPMMKW